MATKKTEKTKKPSGLKLTRKGNTMAAEWKIKGKDYNDGQVFQYKIGKLKWKKKSVGKKTTKKSFTVTFGSFFPYSSRKIGSVRFKVRGNQKDTAKVKYTASDWTACVFKVKKPKKPTVTAALSDTYDFTSTFSWKSTNADDQSNYVFTRMQWESRLVKNSYSSAVGAFKLSRTSSSVLSTTAGVSTSAESSQSFNEGSLDGLATGTSYTRWFRCRAQGPAGSSKWTYAKHVYAHPYKAKNIKVVNRIAGDIENAYQLSWYSSVDVAHPIDKTVVQWQNSTPTTDGAPSGDSWEDGVTVKDVDKRNGGKFFASVPGEDEYQWCRINNHHDHDNNTTHGTPFILSAGPVKAPTINSIEVDTDTSRVAITAGCESAYPDVWIALYLFTNDNAEGDVIGILAPGVAQTVPIPSISGTYAFGIKAFQGGNYTASRISGGVTYYTITSTVAESEMVKTEGDVPLAPTAVTVTAVDELEGTIRVTWDWPWTSARVAEIGWADHEDAWYSTDEPETHIVTDLKQSKLHISGLETGVTWYVRVRLKTSTEDDAVAGPWSDIKSVDLSSAPNIPSLQLSDIVIPADGKTTASWTFVSTDGTDQAFAQIYDYDEDNDTYTKVISTDTAQHVTIDASIQGWQTGETHNLVLELTAASGKASEYSEPVTLSIADAPTCEITDTSILLNQEVTTDEQTRTVNILDAMPLTLTVTGADEEGTTTVIIERAADYQISRPDESEYIGYEGETVCIYTQTGEEEISIDIDSDYLVGRLDDTAEYRLIATATDTIGQVSEPVILPFEVQWSVQAVAPTATVEIDDEYDIARITPDEIAGMTFDIYRLSTDKPVLIYEDAEGGVTYVDPYPTIGSTGGHRIVCKTAQDDYIYVDADGADTFAWVDLQEDDGDYIDSSANIIDFANGRVEAEYNIDVSNSWKKSFETTQYLGGSVQGDWLPAVERTGSVSGVHITTQDMDQIQALRRLADYSGICHIRTKDGSSFACNIDVSEDYKVSTAHKHASFSLDITRVDTEELDGMTLEEWEEIHEEEG